MKNILIAICTVLIVGVACGESAHAQVRVPTPNVAALASQPDENVSVQETETVTWSAPVTSQVTPIQYAMPAQEQPQTLPPQHVTPQQVSQQVQPQMQFAVPQSVPQLMPQSGMMPGIGMPNGAIIIPVVVPQYLTYTPPPVTMMVNQPAQLVIPQYPAPMMQPMYNPMAMQMMPQQMAPQQMMVPMSPVMPMMQSQAPPQQPIPIKMIMPDGSKVSIKHYIPGQYFKNAVRAVTP